VQDSETYYDVLEVPESASQAEIRKAWLRLQKEYHPDKVPENLGRLRKDAEEKLKCINEAYEVLGSPDKRKQYDAQLANLGAQETSVAGSPPYTPPPAPPPPQNTWNASPPPPSPPPSWTPSGTASGPSPNSPASNVPPSSSGSRTGLRAFWGNAIGCVAGFIFAEIAGPTASRVVMAIEPQPPNWLGACLVFWLLVSAVLVGVFVAAILRGNGKRAARVSVWGTVLTIVLALLIAASVSNDQSKSSSGYVSNNPGVLVNTKLPAPPNTTIMDDFNGSSVGSAYGISYVEQPDNHAKRAALFRQDASSRIEYRNGIPTEGTLEWIVNVTGGYYYGDFRSFSHQNRALIFSTDASGGDVTWPGTAKLSVSSNGDISFFLATNKYNQPPTDPLEAKGTKFRFNEWHAIAISYGSQGQAIMVDGSVVAESPEHTQILGAAGNHQEPLDIPTLGECVSHYWAHHRYEGGFEGMVAEFRASKAQKDWYVARDYGLASASGDAETQSNGASDINPGESASAKVSESAPSVDVAPVLSSPPEPQVIPNSSFGSGSGAKTSNAESSSVSADSVPASPPPPQDKDHSSVQRGNEPTLELNTSAPQNLLASAYLRSHGPAQFQATAAEVLRRSGSVTIELMHEHSGLSGDSIHPVTVTLTPTTITYDPGSFSCKYPRFSAPLQNVQVAEVSNKTVEGRVIGIVVRHILPGTYLLHLEVRDPARSNDKVKLYLATADSYTVKQGNSVNYLASRSNSAQVLGAVANIIRQAATSGH
jgi:hypothetical protein